MKNILILVIAIMTINLAIAKDGVLNVNSAKLLPSRASNSEENNVGIFAFDIYESTDRDVTPVEGAPAQITISLSNIDLVDGIKSVHGYQDYFDIAIGNVGGITNIYLQQKATIPGGTSLPIRINVLNAENAFDDGNVGGNVNLTPGVGQRVAVDYTEVNISNKQVDDYIDPKNIINKEL